LLYKLVTSVAKPTLAADTITILFAAMGKQYTRYQVITLSIAFSNS